MSGTRPSSSSRFRPAFLFRPDSVAVIGTETEVGTKVLANIRAGGFPGTIMEARGPDLSGLQLAPDLAVVATPPQHVAPALAALGRRGCFAAVVPVMAPELGAAAAATGVRIYGPGSFGLAVPGLHLNATLSHLAPPAGRTALVSQSAALCRVVLDWAGPNGVGFSHIIGIGGNADLGFAAALDWLSADSGTGLILLDIRRIRNRRAFLSAARACARLRPVVAIRAGARLLDAEGGAEAAFEAGLRRAGVLTVSRLDDFLAAAETLTRARPLRRDTLAIVTNAIGPGQLAADAALREGVALAALSDPTRAVLQLALPEGARGPGPAYTGVEDPMRLAETAALLAGAPEVGAVLVVHAPTGDGDETAITALTAGAASLRVPLLVCAMGESTAAAHRARLAEAGVPVFPTPEQAVRGFLHLVQQRRAREAMRELPPSKVLALAPDQPHARSIFQRARAAGRLNLMQDEALAVLTAYGVPAVPSRVAATPEDAAAASTLLGFPAVVKLRRTDPPQAAPLHSLGLDLTEPDEVARMANALARQRARRAPGAPDLGFLVQRQVGRARELRIRVGEDPMFGPTIAFGQGGTTAEILGDLAYDLPPLNLPLAHALIARTRAARLLGAFRDLPEAREEAVAETLVRISQLVVDFPEIAELELNPLFADTEGVLAGDAWIRLRPDGETGTLAIPPYPAELIEHVVLKGEALTIRPIRPEDAEAHGAFFARLSPEDVRYRFFSALRELTPEQMARLTQVDYEREMAFIAVREATGETVGVARLVREGGPGEAEFAVVVQQDAKGRGIATRLLQRIMEWGRAQGLTEIFGQILADNHPMLSFVRRSGFSIRHLPHDADVVEARLSLV